VTKINCEEVCIISYIGWVPSIVFLFDPFTSENDQMNVQTNIIKSEYVYSTSTKFTERSLTSRISISNIEAMPLSNVCIELFFESEPP
jgi:hypothetical protein